MKKKVSYTGQSSLYGECYPIGSTLFQDGVNFSLFCKNGTSVKLLFFDLMEDIKPSKIITLDPQLNRTHHYWHVFVPGISAGQLYAYIVEGPWEPSNGHRYNAANILLDPYSHIVAVPQKYKRYAFNDPETESPSMKSMVTDLSTYDWEDDKHIRRPFAQTVIYEMHVAGFTRNPNSSISEEKRGTYAGLIEKIPYLKTLGITAVELLPVFQFDEQDCPTGLINYWGYSPVSFFAPHHGYNSSKQPEKILDEFRDMVKAFHKADIEVILDVVFNHTAEGNDKGPSFCFRGIDNSTYYILEPDKTYYSNYSGTGNTLNANQPIVRRMIIDSLHFWVTEMHVDGFRFDLASILSRDETGNPVENPPVLWDIDSDPVLASVKLIAEAWDAAGLYQVGHFIGDRWKEWNGRFRDDVRSFLKGDEGIISKLASRLVGSPDIYSHEDREPEQSINFVTCHDGFTLNDVVSYNNKHNEANNEDNRDGNNDNLSWNCGIEGPSDDANTEALRNRQIKNFFLITMLSVGAPMLSMGDELRRTQLGNNNAYCQDNELSWFDWSLLQKHKDLYRFVQVLIHERLQRDLSKAEFSMTLNQFLSKATITWHGVKVNQPDWSHQSHSIAFTAISLGGAMAVHYMLNSYWEPLEFELPAVKKDIQWKRWMDTALEPPDDIFSRQDAPAMLNEKYVVQSHSSAILFAEL